MLNHVTYGQAGDHALLLIHALGADLRFWEEAGPLLAERYYCVAPDLRPVGGSPRSDRPVTVERHLADFEDLRLSLGIRTLVAVGTAMGGLVCAHYAAAYPDVVTALVMTNPGLRNTEAAKAMLRERLVEIRARGMGFLVPGAVDRTFHELPHDDRYARYLARYAAQDPDAYIQSVKGFLDIDVGEIAPRIACPTLLVPGEHDILMAREDSPALQRLIPQARLEPLSGSAHFVPYQSPDRFARMVVAFLDDIAGTPDRRAA